MKTTILGGILFLAPLAVLAILLGKVYQIGLLVAAPVDRLIPVTQIGGLALVNILAIVMILLVCYLAGLVARSQFMQARVRRIDDLLIDVLPTYAVFKGMLGSMSGSKDVATLMKPVVAKFDDYDQIAFEMERDETQAVLFIPGAPSAWSGTTVVVTLDRVQPLDLPTHQAVKLMRVMGRGTLATQRKLAGNQAL
ncbi:hypothetical protein CEP88_13285 [Roseobacter denitrificans]|uniref:Conserved hypothetical n=1 Tax=Roseobacter denitrificans (strain ATCC 33942 / OCh 114) TaxID=375451 RepID=Q16CH1_ROSDO|nr:hypothetical protein [Roseobacter denitrificans]ABG30322.1 conserved hypothetical [Roseobacter denitrificans OCh 114]AVL53491.1 hypothetical protein CEP88_13285 [Roseobacter denitrificans]SFF71596.1 Uncharacterized membrane protein [Roseobacter denitrificans OCh 114]